MKTIALILILVLPPLPRVTCDEDNDQPFRPTVQATLKVPPLARKAVAKHAFDGSVDAGNQCIVCWELEDHPNHPTRRPKMSAPFHNIGLLVSVCKEAVKEAEQSGEPLPAWHSKMKGLLMMFEPNPKPEPDDGRSDG